MLINFSILAVLAITTVLSVRFILITGIDTICTRFKLSSKTKGQIIGYATSVPEFTVVVSSAFAGVFTAGLWNIASSNIINWVLFSSAVLFYHQQKDMLHKKFIEEIIFAFVAVLIPLGLSISRIGLNAPMAIGLLLLFVVYKILDHVFNSKTVVTMKSDKSASNIEIGILQLISGILIIIVCGKYLGRYSERLIMQIGVPAWAIGWILGFITSIPEMTSFFEIFRIHKKRGTIHLTDDMQEALDTLVASNFTNLGIILPIGLIILTFF